MADVAQLQSKLAALLAAITPQARRQLARRIGQALRKSQAARIASQQNPDGTAYSPRKPRKEFDKKQGRIKRRAMFAKLRTARHFKIQSTANDVAVGFTGNTAAIAAVHQYGLTGIVDKKRGIKTQYAQRELLGFSHDDLDIIEDLIIEQLSKG